VNISREKGETLRTIYRHNLSIEQLRGEFQMT